VAVKRIWVLVFLTGTLFCGYAQNAGRTLEELHEAIMREPENALLYRERAIANMALKQYLDALNDFSRAIVLEPNAENYEYRGIFFCEGGFYRDGIVDFNRAIEIEPTRVTTYLIRGRAYGRMQEYRRAIEDLTKAIELDPQYSSSYLDRGIIYIRIGQIETGLEDFNTMLKMETENPSLGMEIPGIFYWRGIAYNRLGKYHEAIADFDHTLELIPSFVEAYIASEPGEQIRTFDTIKEYVRLGAVVNSYSERGTAYQALANQEENRAKRAEYQRKAEEDFAMAEELGGTR
jgi:tetratricopeptide (TPR) repeat protein